jgi:hypothetical protein
MRVPDSHLPKGLAAAASSSSNNKSEAVLPIIKKVRVKFSFSFLFKQLKGSPLICGLLHPPTPCDLRSGTPAHNTFYVHMRRVFPGG